MKYCRVCGKGDLRYVLGICFCLGLILGFSLGYGRSLSLYKEWRGEQDRINAATMETIEEVRSFIGDTKSIRRSRQPTLPRSGQGGS